MNLNNIGREFWENNLNKAKDVINNLSIESAQKWWNDYMVQSPEELANVARASMHRKNTIMSNLNMGDFNKAFASADKSNSEYITEFNKLKGALNVGNIDEAKSVATRISDRFQDESYLKYLQDAEKSYYNKKSRIDSLDSETIRSAFIGETKQKIANNKIIGNFTDGEKMAGAAYTLNPRNIPAYFTTEDKKKNRIRAGVTAGAYMGTSMVVRGIQGGNPITNEYGERDIAGIPFI